MIYFIRPIAFGPFAVYRLIGENKAEVVFEGERWACVNKMRELEKLS